MRRGNCPRCGREVAFKADGTPRKHRRPKGQILATPGTFCPGTPKRKASHNGFWIVNSGGVRIVDPNATRTFSGTMEQIRAVGRVAGFGKKYYLDRIRHAGSGARVTREEMLRYMYEEEEAKRGGGAA